MGKRLYWRDKPLTCRVTRDDSRDDCGCCKLFRVDVLAGIGGPVLHTDWLRYPAGSSGYRVEDGERVILSFWESLHVALKGFIVDDYDLHHEGNIDHSWAKSHIKEVAKRHNVELAGMVKVAVDGESHSSVVVS